MSAPAVEYPELFKIGARDQIQTWRICVYDRGGIGEIFIQWGEVGGVIQHTKEIVRQGKNIGKSNETTPLQQAVDQAQSRWKKQQDRYYGVDLDEARKLRGKMTRPMLAQKFEDKQHLLEPGDPIYTQPKLDGMRCIARRDGDEIVLVSRGEKLITATPHIVDALMPIMEDGNVWDGELWREGYKLEDIISACRRKEPNDLSARMQLHVFDSVEDADYHDRFLTTVLQRIVGRSKAVTGVSTKEMEYDPARIQEWLTEYEESGYEGMIMRLARQGAYEHKRTANLLKLKSWHDMECLITGYATAKEGSRKHGLMVNFVLETTDLSGATVPFRATLRGEEDILREMWKKREEFVGQFATITYQDLTKKGIPHFAKVKSVRWEGDMSPRIDLMKKT